MRLFYSHKFQDLKEESLHQSLSAMSKALMSSPSRRHDVWLRSSPTVQAHPGLMAASMPWLSGLDFKRLCTWFPYVSIALVLTRDKGSGRVTIGRDGLPRIHYWPNSHDRTSMMDVSFSALASLQTFFAWLSQTLQVHDGCKSLLHSHPLLKN